MRAAVVKEGADAVGASRQASYVAGQVVAQLGLAARGWLASDPMFDVGIEVFVWVEVRTVRRQMEHLDPLRPLGQPSLHGGRAVHRQAIEDQEYLLRQVTDQP